MKRLITLAGVGALPLLAHAAPLFSESFDTDATANWQYNSSIAGDSATNNLGNEANFFFDYSTVGIPSAPRSTGGTTVGLKMEANVFGTTPGVFSGMSASPLGQSFSGDYVLKFDAWQNYQGSFPGGGNGTTQALMGGVGSATTTAQFPGGTFNGVGFAATGDGGSAQDYRAYNGPGAPIATTTGTYAAGTATSAINSSDPYYSGFQGSVPAAQTAFATSQGFNNQTGSTSAGALGMAWRTWEVSKVGTTVTWIVDGRTIATVANANPAGSNIFLGYFDTTAGASTDAISRQLLFGLVDNVQVDRIQAVPEPATLSVLGLGALAMFRRRRRNAR